MRTIVVIIRIEPLLGRGRLGRRNLLDEAEQQRMSRFGHLAMVVTIEL